MKRLHLFEIEDQRWCPRVLRDALTDYLQFALAADRSYAPIVPLLAEALKKTGAKHVLDLCSGAAGPWLWLLPVLRRAGQDPAVRLTDAQPNVAAFERAHRHSNGVITGHADPVDATAVPASLEGFRTLFTSFHHFRPAQARAILADAVRHGRGIGIFEATQRHPKAMLAMILAPLAVWLMTPFIRPFRWSRLLWTYLIPVVPLLILFDGLVSCLRVYHADELRELIAGLNADGYEWKVGLARGYRRPIPITYLVGVPAAAGG